MEDLQDKIIELMDLFDDEQVTTADKIDRPQQALDRDMYKDFMDRNPMAGGGRIAFGDGSVTPIKQGKNKGKFHLRLGSGKFRRTYIGTEKELNKIFKNRKTAGGDTTKGLENKKYKKNFLPRNKFLKFLKDNNIKAESAANFAERYGIKREPNPFNKNQFIYSTEQFNKNFIDDIMKRQVATGQATDFAKKKFPVKTKSELQKPRLEAIEAKGGIKKNDPFAAPRGSGAQLGHTGNIFGTELITGDRLAYTPSQVNELMSRKGNLDDKIRTVSAKIENIKKSNKSPKVKKDLLEQADNILIRLASQSQGFKKVTLSDGSTFGGDRLTIDPFDIYKGKTEKEIVQLQKQYLNKPIITEEMAAKNPNLKATSPEEIAKIQDAYFFEENRKASLKAAQDFPKQELNKIISELNNPDQIRLARIGCPGKATGGRVGYFEGQNLTLCAIRGAEKIKNDPINLTGGDQQNLRALGKSAKAVRFLKNFLGPAAVAGELIFEGGFAANKFMSQGIPLKQALGESYINKYILGPKTQIDVEAERAKEFAKGEDFAMAKRGERMRPFMAQSATADAQRLKKREEEMKALYPQLGMLNFSNQEIDKMLEAQGVYSPFTLGFGMQQRQPGIGDMKYNEDLAYDEIRDVFRKGAEESIREQQMQSIADAGGIANLAKGGRAGYKLGKLIKVKPSKVREDVKAIIDDSMKMQQEIDTTTELDKLIKKTLDEDLFDKKDRIVDSINISEAKKRRNYPYNMQVFEEPKNLDFYRDIKESNFRTKTGPYYDRIRRLNKAGGGLLKQAGDRSGAPPESGPNPQGLQGLLNRGKKT